MVEVDFLTACNSTMAPRNSLGGRLHPAEFFSPRLHLRRGLSGDPRLLFRDYMGCGERSTFLARGVHKSLGDTERFVSTWCDENWDSGSNQFAWIIADRASGEAIGTFVMICVSHKCEVHFGLSRARSGVGLATEALQAATTWIWRNGREVQRIWTACDVENIAAHRVLEKAGFEREGTLKRWLVLPKFGPAARDCISYALLRP